MEDGSITLTKPTRGPYLFEILAVGNAALSLIVIGHEVGWLSWRAVWATLSMGTLYSIAMIVVALAMRAGMHILRERRVLPAFLRAVQGVDAVLLLRILVASSLTMFGYMWLKLLLPLLRTATEDATLWRLDLLFHHGVPPAAFLLPLLSRFDVLFIVDLHYGSYLLITLMVFSWAVTDPDRDRIVRFVNGYLLLWVMGGWLYLAFPALGPCYIHREVFRPFAIKMPIASLAQDYLWQNYQRVLMTRTTGVLAAPFNPGAGIAAFPSLHVGVHFFFFLSNISRGWLVRMVFLGMAMMTILGSVVTGWHYAIDAYAGVLLAVFVALGVYGTGARGLLPARHALDRHC